MKVLVVDDSKTARLFSKKCLEMSLPGKTITFDEAEDGEKALKKVKETKFDMVLCDVNMPVMTGFTFLRNVKQDPANKDVPIVFVTSMANEARTDNLTQLGAFDVISKPLTPQKIKKVLEKMQLVSSGTSESGWG